MKSISGKVALVTGAAGGIGAAIVRALLENGAKGVAIVDIAEEAGKELLDEILGKYGSHKAIFIKTDVTNKKQLKDAFEPAVQTFKQLDLVINNAGIIDEHNPARTLAVNFGALAAGTYLALQNYLPKYKSDSEGVIINTASVLGLYVVPAIPMYCASKHAVVGLGRALGQRDAYNQYKVRILTLCPGLIDTELIDDNQMQKNALYPHTWKPSLNEVHAIKQTPEYVGKAVIEILKIGKNGSVWVVVDGKPLYEYEPNPENL